MCVLNGPITLTDTHVDMSTHMHLCVGNVNCYLTRLHPAFEYVYMHVSIMACKVHCNAVETILISDVCA